MTNLGKLFILSILSLNLGFAQFSVSLSQTKVSQGDTVVLTFASNVSEKFPLISDIGGVAIVRQSRESSTSYVNGVRTGSYKKHFLFVPEKSMTVPAYTMIENGKKVTSKPIKITVTQEKHDNPNDELFFKAFLSKKTVVVGEPFFVTLTYKQAKDLDVLDRRLVKPSGKHLWVEDKPIESASETATHMGVKIKYVFTAQKSGKLTINPAHIKIGTAAYARDAWGNLRATTRYKTLFTNALSINVKPLPKGVENVGDFRLSVTADKQKSDEKDAVNVTISIAGEGNIVDIPAFKLPLDSVLVYDEKPKKDHAYKDGKYQGTFSQKFAIVSDHNYTIPSLKFSYYSLKKRKTMTVTSKPIKIEIKPTSTASLAKELKIEKLQVNEPVTAVLPTQRQRSWLELMIAMLVGIVLGLIMKRPSFKLKTKEPSYRANLKNEKSILQALMPFSDSNEEAKAFVEILSENIYDKAQNSYDKKALHKLLKHLGIKK